MANLNNINLNCGMIGALPSSYMVSLSYEEQLLLLSKKMEEIINFMNNTLSTELKNYINNEFNNIMLNSMYEEETETLILYLKK